jgi:hypothetical protein
VRLADRSPFLPPQHTKMRQRYLDNGEKEEPFLESVLPPDGCLFAQQEGGAIFINRLILPSTARKDTKPQLFDEVIPIKTGWRLFKIDPSAHPSKEEEQAIASLSFLSPSLISITESQDVKEDYRSFLGNGAYKYALIRPDQYVFAKFSDIAHLSGSIDKIRARVCAL